MPGQFDGGREPPDNGDMEARVSKLEALAEKTQERLFAIERAIAVLDSTHATKTDLHSIDGSIRADMHKEFTMQTWRIIGAMLTFGAMLSAAVFFIARNVK